MEGTHKILKPSMFPPSDGGGEARFGLERCMRVLPQSQDTGGFFITLLRKTGELTNLRGMGTLQRSTGAGQACDNRCQAKPLSLLLLPLQRLVQRHLRRQRTISLPRNLLRRSPSSASCLISTARVAVLRFLPVFDDPIGSNSHKKAAQQQAEGGWEGAEVQRGSVHPDG